MDARSGVELIRYNVCDVASMVAFDDGSSTALLRPGLGPVEVATVNHNIGKGNRRIGEQ
jgi:hypothetical protein